MSRVYLAGPITGLSYGEAREGWRAKFAALLPAGIDPYSPMRGKDYLLGEKSLRGDPKMYEQAASTAKGILGRDYNDVVTCDVMVACFLGSERVSIGTVSEFGFAYANRKPIVLIMSKDGNDPHYHAFITEMSTYWVETLEEAALLTKLLVTGGI